MFVLFGGFPVARMLHDRLVRLGAAAKRSEEAADDARAARDAAIADAEDQGWSLATIAEAVDLSVSQVGRIAVRQTHRGQDQSTTSDR